MARKSKVLGWLFAAGFVLLSPPVQASGGVRIVPLEQAVGRGKAVFVVERNEPFLQVVRLRHQPSRRAAPRRNEREPVELTITYLSFTIKEVLADSQSDYSVSKGDIEASPPGKAAMLIPSDEKGRFQVALPRRPGDRIWVASSADILNNGLSRLSVEKGVNKIPIYERLDGRIGPDAIVAGKQYVLLARPAPAYVCWTGVADLGLVGIEKKDEIVRLLARGKGTAPAAP